MIYNIITDDYYFYNWLQNSDNYKNKFSLEGSKALQAHIEDRGNNRGKNIEFDPIEWCCDYSEYDSLEDFNKNYYSDNKDDYLTLEQLSDNIGVIKLDNNHIIIREF